RPSGDRAGAAPARRSPLAAASAASTQARTGAGRSPWGLPPRARPRPLCALLAGEVRLALLDVGAQPLFGVVALEELLLELALERQGGLERDLGTRLDRALDPPDRLGGAVRRAEALGELLDP